MTKDETSEYMLHHLARREIPPICAPSGRESVITQPSPGLTMKRPAFTKSRVSPGRAMARSPRSRSLADGGKVGAGGVAAAGAVEGVDALPHSVAVERRACGPAKPSDRRERLRPTDAREHDCRARQPRDLSLQRHHDRLGHFRQRRGETSIRDAPDRRVRSRHGIGRCIRSGKSEPRTGGNTGRNCPLGHQHWSTAALACRQVAPTG